MAVIHRRWGRVAVVTAALVDTALVGWLVAGVAAETRRPETVASARVRPAPPVVAPASAGAPAAAREPQPIAAGTRRSSRAPLAPTPVRILAVDDAVELGLPNEDAFVDLGHDKWVSLAAHLALDAAAEREAWNAIAEFRRTLRRHVVAALRAGDAPEQFSEPKFLDEPDLVAARRRALATLRRHIPEARLSSIARFEPALFPELITQGESE